jgi:hypothetical protein
MKTAIHRMPALDYNDDKLATAMARLDSIQHPKTLARFGGNKPPLPNDKKQKLPELSSKALNNYNVYKERVETPTSKLVTKYWSRNKDRFADMSRLSAETAPGALQTSFTAFSTPDESPVQSRVTSPSKETHKNNSLLNKRREMTIFKTSKQLKNSKRSSNNLGAINKYQLLRSRSLACDIQEDDNEDAERDGVQLTIQDLTDFSHKTLLDRDREHQRGSPVKTNLYNSSVDVKKFRKFLKDPEPSFYQEFTERKYVNYCDEEKTLVIQKWLEEVNRVHRLEGYWTDTIDKSLIRQSIPKHVPSDWKEIRSVSNLQMSQAHDANVTHLQT